MKNKALNLFTLFFSTAILFSQEQYKIGIVEYDMYTSLYGNKYVQAKLYFNKDKSLFVYDNSERVKKIVEEDGYNIKAEISGGLDKIGRRFYTNFKKQELIFRDDVARNIYLVKEPLPKIKWKLLDKTKSIGGYTCQKAKGVFRGREYIAWFTSEIPVKTGPWKLQGLPGLILEAHSLDKKIVFSLIYLDDNLNNKDVIKPPKDGKKISIKEFLEKSKNADAELQKRIKSKMPKGIQVNIKSLIEKEPKELTIHVNKIVSQN